MIGVMPTSALRRISRGSQSKPLAASQCDMYIRVRDIWGSPGATSPVVGWVTHRAGWEGDIGGVAEPKGFRKLDSPPARPAPLPSGSSRPPPARAI